MLSVQTANHRLKAKGRKVRFQWSAMTDTKTVRLDKQNSEMNKKREDLIWSLLLKIFLSAKMTSKSWFNLRFHQLKPQTGRVIPSPSVHLWQRRAEGENKTLKEWHLPPWQGVGTQNSRVRKAPTRSKCRALIFSCWKLSPPHSL